ncbi:MAG: PEP-CTERM sorting domain-containing protein [Planctomycetota bacterium]
MKTWTGSLAVLAGLGLAANASAQADFQITEAYTGISGPDGTADWLEISNLGDAAGSLLGLAVDDESADFTAGGDLPDFTLTPGASVVVLIDLDPGTTAAEIADFEAVWGTGIDVIGVEGGGSFGGGGDAAVLLDGVDSPVDFLVTPGDLSGLLATITDIDGDGSSAGAILGFEGAFESNPFANDNFPGGTVTLVGSPGVVPEPASVALLAVAGFALIRRR